MGQGAGLPGGQVRPCPGLDESSTYCNSARTTAAPDASDPRPRRPHGRCTRAGSTRSAFRRSRLPRRARRNGFVPDAHGPQSTRDIGTINPVLITDQVAWSFIPRERLRDLACNPFCVRVRRDVDPNQFAALRLRLCTVNSKNRSGTGRSRPVPRIEYAPSLDDVGYAERGQRAGVLSARWRYLHSRCRQGQRTDSRSRCRSRRRSHCQHICRSALAALSAE